ncbi:MAG TPA: hypothetical protein VMD27_12975 [Candidatus Aquilonibacter sp.]|nr:hypothetical protein [Candidatus Aquilonibacter sp.]
MAKLKIPATEYEVLAKIAELSDTAFAEFFKAISESDTKILRMDFSEQLAPKVLSIPD